MPALLHDPKQHELSSLIKSGVPVVVDFFAEWCGPCKAIAPVFLNLVEGHQRVHFVKVDVDKCPHIAAEYNITAMPTFIAFKDGKQVQVIRGADSLQLQSLVASL
jgi:thioredoxin 1